MADSARLFFSYSHRDQELRSELEKHLAPLKRASLIASWHDRMIQPGDEWAKEIDRQLNTADIILLLVSADFLSSDYCWGIEMERALARHDAGEARVIPIILHPCDWEPAPFSRLQALPREARPISEWPNRAAGLADVARGIRLVVQELAGKRPTATAPSGKTSNIEPVLTEPHVKAVVPVPRLGEVRTNPADGQPYVWIPPGTFQMGASPGDRECDDVETPAHPVKLTRGFWIGQTPVTQSAFEKVAGSNPSHFKGPQRPVEQVTWYEADAYCKAVGGRLPTEAEWEWAARAGSTSARFGELDSIAWYSANSGKATKPVRAKQPNAWGLYDMLGNVWEWCSDWFGLYSSGEQTDPQGPASGEGRVVRGGSWNIDLGVVRVSVRGRYRPVNRGNSFGFRCVWEVIP